MPRQVTYLSDPRTRQQTMMDISEVEQTAKLLSQLKRNDPLKKEQREKLINSIKTLNEHLGLGAPLRQMGQRSSSYHTAMPPSPNRRTTN
jgi:hypothetical protein